MEYVLNDEGKKVKVLCSLACYKREIRPDSLSTTAQITRKIKRTLQKSLVDHSVAERKTWSKFGQEKGSKAGPDRATTTVGEAVMLKLSAGNKVRAIFMLRKLDKQFVDLLRLNYVAIRTRAIC